MEAVLESIKEKKVSLGYLSETTGYSIPHLSNVINSNKRTTKALYKAIIHALKIHKNFTAKEVQELWDSTKDKIDYISRR